MSPAVVDAAAAAATAAMQQAIPQKGPPLQQIALVLLPKPRSPSKLRVLD